MDDFKKLIDNSLLQKVAIVGGTMGIREIVEFVDLKCPCLEEYNVVYAWCSMLIPALVFFLMGLLPMRRMCGYSSYRYFASICGGTEGETPDHPFSSFSFSCEKGKRTECCYNLCCYLDTALVAPITWIIAVHLQGDLFICANATQNYTSLPCKDPEKEMLNENQKNFLSESKARSQMIGWIFMAGAIALLVLSVFCNRCVDAEIVINKKYMDAAYDALNNEFYKRKKKKAISDLKNKLKKKRVRDRPTIHPGDSAVVPLMEHDLSVTSGRIVIPAAKVCSLASHSSGDIPAAKVCSPASHSSGAACARRDSFPASGFSGVETETSDLPAHTTSFLMKNELHSVETETSDLPAHTTSFEMKRESQSVRDRPAKHPVLRFAKTLGDHAAIPLMERDPSMTSVRKVGDLPAKHPGDRFAESLGDYAAIPLLRRDPSMTSVRMVGDLPAKHPGDRYGQSFGDYAAIPRMERCRSMTSVRNDIPAAKVCSLASHSSGDIPAAKVCSAASPSFRVEAETSDLPAHKTSFRDIPAVKVRSPVPRSSCAMGARRDLFPASHSFGVEAATSDLPAYPPSSCAVGARRDLFPASHSFGVEAATSDLPAHPPSFGAVGARRDLFPASHSFGAMGARRDLFPASHSFGVERATSDLPADPPSSSDEDSEDTDEEWDNIVNLYKRA